MIYPHKIALYRTHLRNGPSGMTMGESLLTGRTVALVSHPITTVEPLTYSRVGSYEPGTRLDGLLTTGPVSVYTYSVTMPIDALASWTDDGVPSIGPIFSEPNPFGRDIQLGAYIQGQAYAPGLRVIDSERVGATLFVTVVYHIANSILG